MVVHGKSFGEKIQLIWRMPPGSMLGPLLFIMYINGPPYYLSLSGIKSLMYADDVTLSIRMTKIESSLQTLTRFLEKIG